MNAVDNLVLGVGWFNNVRREYPVTLIMLSLSSLDILIGT